MELEQVEHDPFADDAPPAAGNNPQGLMSGILQRWRDGTNNVAQGQFQGALSGAADMASNVAKGAGNVASGLYDWATLPGREPVHVPPDSYTDDSGRVMVKQNGQLVPWQDVDPQGARAYEDDMRARSQYGPQMALSMMGGTPFRGAPAGSIGMGSGPKALLPMDDASRMVRSTEQGFKTDTPLYHGTTKSIGNTIHEFNIPTSGENAVFLTDNPKDAYEFGSMKASDKRNIAVKKFYVNTKDFHDVNVKGEIYDPEMMASHLSDAQKAGAPGAIIRNIQNFEYGEPSTTYAIFDKSRIRSHDAAFNPANSDSGFLLGSGATDKKLGAAIGALGQEHEITNLLEQVPGIQQAKDIERQGGWTLDSHVPQPKALAAGFDQPAYHGTHWFEGQKVKDDGGFFSTPDPELASLYAGPEWHGGQNGKILPLLLKTKDYHTFDAAGKTWSQVNSDAIAAARDKGAPGVRINNVWDEPSTKGYLSEPKTVFISLEPSTVRSRFANFDPAKMHLNDLLASGAATAVPASAIAHKYLIPVDHDPFAEDAK